MNYRLNVFKINYNWKTELTFQNVAEGIEAIFVHGKTDGELWAVGVIHLPIKNEVFTLSHCGGKKCFLWKKVEGY